MDWTTERINRLRLLISVVVLPWEGRPPHGPFWDGERHKPVGVAGVDEVPSLAFVKAHPAMQGRA